MSVTDFDKVDSLLKWTVLKNKLRQPIINNNFHVFNNFIYWAHLGVNIGSEQEKDRPVLVVRTTKASPICTVLPITLERLNDNIPYHIDLSNGIGTVLVEQLRTISKDRIFDKKYVNSKHATICEKDLAAINGQLASLYTLKPLFDKNR